MPKISTSKETGEQFLVFDAGELSKDEQAMLAELSELRAQAKAVEAQIEESIRAWPQHVGRDVGVWIKWGKVSVGKARATTVKAKAKPAVSLEQFWAEQANGGHRV